MKKLTGTLIVVGALAACSSAPASSVLSGKFERKVHTSALRGAVNGTWTIAFENGGYAVTDNGKSVLHGRYTTSSSKITFHDKSGRDACPAPGTYRFTRAGGKLTFTRLDDSNPNCIGRATVLSGTFSRIG